MGNVKKDNFEEITKMIDEDQLVERLKALSEMQHVYSAGIKEVTTKLEILDEEFHAKFKYNPIHNIDSRLKSAHSIYQKLKKKELEPNIENIEENIFDIAGVRVVCNYIDDLYKIADYLLKQTDVTLIKYKDYVKTPKENGYRSLHLVITVPIFLSDCIKSVPVEIQIRTIAMDFWASLEHHLKYKSNAKEDVKKQLAVRLKNCAEQINAVDAEMLSISKEVFMQTDK